MSTLKSLFGYLIAFTIISFLVVSAIIGFSLPFLVVFSLIKYLLG